MSHTTDHRMDAGSPPTEGVAATARDEAGHVKETSSDAAREVVGTVKEKASDVTSDAREQARRLFGQTRSEMAGQASQQKERATNGLRSVSDELRGMAEHGQPGLAAHLARHGAEYADQAADFLHKHEPADLLEEVREYARRNPGTFLLIAATAGVVAGRLTRALATGEPGTPISNEASEPPADDGYLVTPPAAPASAPPVAPTTPPPPTPAPVVPDPDPGAPVTPRFGPGRGAVT